MNATEAPTVRIPLRDAAIAALSDELRCELLTLSEQLGEPYETPVPELRKIADAITAKVQMILHVERSRLLEAPADEAERIIDAAIATQTNLLADDPHGQGRPSAVTRDRLDALDDAGSAIAEVK